MVFEVCFGSRYKLGYNWRSSHSNLQKDEACRKPEAVWSPGIWNFHFCVCVIVGGMNDTMPPPVSVYFHSAQSLCIKNEANCYPYLINM